MLINHKQDIKVSVIIPTLNAGDEFASLLSKLTSQTLKPYEIIVADSESTDKTVEIAKQYDAAVLNIKRVEFDHGSTRNVAAEHAKGDILMFMTQDVIPLDNRLIEELVSPFICDIANDKCDIAYSYARQIADHTAHLFERVAREVNYPEQSAIKGYEDIERLGIKTFFCSNACSAIRKDVFIKLGGFVNPTIFNEDMFMAARCVLTGKKIAYRADAKVFHTHTYTIKQQFKRYFDNGMSMRSQSWILPYAKAGKAGAGLVKKQLKALKQEKKLLLLPRLVLESAAKLLGYKLGVNVHRLPKFISRKLSMHTLIYEKIAILNSFANSSTREDVKSFSASE